MRTLFERTFGLSEGQPCRHVLHMWYDLNNHNMHYHGYHSVYVIRKCKLYFRLLHGFDYQKGY